MYPKINPRVLGDPVVLYRNDNFLTSAEIKQFQKLLHSPTWTPSPSPEKVQFFNKDLYNNYQWDNNWGRVGWRDDTPVEWENLYNKISTHLPRHRVHWIDVKLTPPLCTGTPRHRDKDPWIPGGSSECDKALTVLCNLNAEWDPQWGGDFVLYSAKEGQNSNVDLEEFESVAISPGQLLIVENCWHSVAPITAMDHSRISFILHVLQYKQV